MLNFDLQINGQSVDLDSKASIALTKTYESLENPTKIFTDYSKTVTIPMTARNNIIFENAFRPDQVVTTGGLDPRKKVGFILFNNQTIIMVGVAKVVDTASNSPKDRNYYIILYSKMGEIFNDLKQLTFHPTEDSKYTIPNPLSYGCKIDRNIVANSFRQESHNIDLASKGDLDYIGFMPTYQGKYPDFKSDREEVAPGMFDWTDSPEDGDGNDLDEGIEVDEHYQHEFRSYYQQPFVYVDAIWQLLKQKIEQMGDYRLELDPSWFNPQNPYYTNLVITMPSLYGNSQSEAGEEPTEHLAVHHNNYVSNTAAQADLSNNHKQMLSFSHASGTHVYQAGNRFYANGKPVHFHSQFEFTLFAANPDPQLSDGYARLRDDNNLYLEIRAVDAYTGQHIPGAVSKYMFYSNETDHASDAYTSIDLGITARNYPRYVTTPDDDVVTVYNGYAWAGQLVADFDVVWPNPFCIIANQYAANNGDPFEYALGSWVPRWDWLWTDFFTIGNSVSGLYWYLTSFGTECTVTYANRSNSKLTMNRIWSLERTPFELMLDYCKMFRLVFDLDTDDRTVRVMSRDRFFENSTIEDWTDKLDRTKEFKLKPINFDKKWLDFKLADGKGGLFERYHSLYGRNYGSYRVETGYDFNSEAVEAFAELPPSMIASKQQNSAMFNTMHPSRSGFRGYDYKYLPNEYYPDNDNEGSNAGNSGQFYFRNGTYAPDPTISWPKDDGSHCVLVTDDTDWQMTHGEYCWTRYGSYAVECDRLPAISTWSGDGQYSVFFAKPKELYFKRSLINFSNDSYIYDKFWRDYLDDRYSVQTKVLSTYLYLTSDDWMKFKFNKFILIDNILYMVNQIKDFDLSTDRSTKVELVQVNDRDSYSHTGARFPYLYTMPDAVAISSGPSVGVDVFSSSAWSVSSCSDWLYAVKNGDRLDIYRYNINYTLTAEGVVILTNADGLQWAVTVANTQNGRLTPSTNTLHFVYGGATKTLTVSCGGNTPIVASKPDWITAAFNTTSWNYRDLVPGTGLTDARSADIAALRSDSVQLTVTAARNSARSARNGYIVVSNNAGSCVIRVSQSGNPSIIPITPGGGHDISANDDFDIDRLSLAAGEASEVELNTPSQVDFLTLGISNGLTDSTDSPNIGETSFHVQPEISPYHTAAYNRGVDGGYIKVTTVDGENIRWPYNIGASPTYDVYIYAQDNGHVQVNGADGNYVGNHPSGTQLAITATANTGYTFAGWSDGNTTSSRTLTVGTQPIVLYASFVQSVVDRPIAYNLTNVKTSNTAARVADGTRYTTILSPVAGYQIETVKVTMGGTDITASAYSGGKVTIERVTGSVAITANATVIEKEWNYKWSADDGVAPLNFKNFDTSTGDLSQCEPDTGGSFMDFNGKKVWLHDADSGNEWFMPGPTNIETLEIEAVVGFKDPGGGYPLLEMSGYTTTDGIEMRLANDYLIEYNKGGAMVSSGLKLDPEKVGLQDFRAMISVDSGKESMKIGSMFGYEGTLEANLSLASKNGIFNANSGSKFMLRELKLRWKLHTEAIPTYTVSVSAGSNGSVSVDGTKGDYSDTVYGGTVMALSAVPDQGETFVKWSDNNTSANRSIIVNSNTNLNAVFGKAPEYVIYYETSDGQPVTPGGTAAHAYGDFCTLVSNTYQDGQGMLVYDKSIWGISGDFFGDEATVTAVTFPDTLEVIDGIAGGFRNTGITSVDLKNVKLINGSVFSGCPITKVYIPKSLQGFGNKVGSITAHPFRDCNLEYIEVDPWNPVFDSRNNCNCIVYTKTDAVIQGSLNSVVDDTIKRIESGAFSRLPLKAMKFGKNVEFIGVKAFDNCSELAELYFASPNPPLPKDADEFFGGPFDGVANSGVLRCPSQSIESYQRYCNTFLPAGWVVEGF